MPELAVCIGCGKNLDPAVAYIREDGLRCPQCNVRAEMAEDQARLDGREEIDLQKSLSRRAKRLARVHTIMLMALVVILARGRESWYTPLLVVPLILGFGLLTRKRWAYFAALATDAVAIQAALVLAVIGAMSVALAVFVGLCATFLLVMVGLLHEAFRKPPARKVDPEVPNLVSRW
jgi:hypothetical protein